MKKKILFLTVCVAFVAAGYGFYVHQEKQKKEISNLTLENIEALAGEESIKDWWNRKDYDCVKVRCTCIGYNFESTRPDFVGEGKGTVAHQWECGSCNGCGWEVIES